MRQEPDRKPTALEMHVLARMARQFGELEPGGQCPSENALATECGVSRTTVRAVLARLASVGLVRRVGRRWVMARRVRKSDYPKTVKPLEPKHRRVSRHLIERLSRGELRPGDHVSEKGVADSLGCSLTPVREAFLTLEPLGLFHKAERSRWCVSRLDPGQLAELIELRLAVEGYCLGKLMRAAAPRGLPQLRRLRERSLRLAGARRIGSEAFLALDTAFHRWLLETSGNRLLVERNTFIYDLIGLQLRNPGFRSDRARQGLEQHLAIMDAILAGDEKGATRLLQGHLKTALETLCGLFEPDSAYQCSACPYFTGGCF